jgi:sulfatase maturation enzyme AslB (radical SAM superfamily)
VTHSASFCVLPWLHVFADERGVMWPCCRSVGSLQPNLRDRDGQPAHLDDPEGLDAAMNTRTMRTLRLEMLAGREPAACERCYMAERLGKPSHRQVENASSRDDIPGLVAATGPDGRIPLRVRSADIRLGNVCNLRCRMCSPQSSKILLPEWADKYGVAVDDARLEPYRSMDWFERPGFWESFERQAPELERINFAGGEPLLIASMVGFLERMVASGRAGAVTVSYNTNLTVLPERVLQLWPAFRAVRVTVSLDGYGAVNDFIRHPSRWQVIDANLRRLDQQHDRLNLQGGLATNTAVQIYNIFRLDELLDHLARAFSHVAVPNLSIVTHPGHLSVQVLTPPLKQLAATRLETAIARSAGLWRERWGAAAEDLIGTLRGILSFMRAQDRSDLLPQFLDWARHQDRFRGQHTPDAIAELAPLFAAGNRASGGCDAG